MQQKIQNHQGHKYTGSPVGYKHHWEYTNPDVIETKERPDQWRFQMRSIKRKVIPTRNMGSIEPGTKYHWMFIGEQTVEKIDENTYTTDLTANKYKLGHKRPYWKGFSYNYPEQKSLNQMKIQYLKEELDKIKEEGKG